MSWSLVVPSNRHDRLEEFVTEWQPLLHRHDVAPICVWDGDTPPSLPAPWTVYGWADIPDLFPRRTDMIRSYGIWQAWLTGSDYTLSLDDDVTPTCDLFAEYQQVFEHGLPVSRYLDVGALTDSGLQMRGFPYRDRERKPVAVQYGGWAGVLDYDAQTQLAGVPDNATFAPVVVAVPAGVAVTGCAMNMAWRTPVAHIMWQLPLHEGRFNRFGDIWAALLAKHVCDRHGVAVAVNGKAQVAHRRLSDPERNYRLEQPGIPHNEHLWDALVQAGGYRDAVSKMADHIRPTDPGWAANLEARCDEWLTLFAA